MEQAGKRRFSNPSQIDANAPNEIERDADQWNSSHRLLWQPKSIGSGGASAAVKQGGRACTLPDSHTSSESTSNEVTVKLRYRVAFDRRLWLTTLVAGLLFLWPLLVYGRPGDFQDSAAYYKGGHAAVSFALQKAHLQDPAPGITAATSVPAPAARLGSNAAEPPAQDPQQVRGARSVAYSVAAYVLGAPRPQMWLLAAAQAFTAGFLCAVSLLLFGDGLRAASIKLLALAVATPIAFTACVIVPDIFAGIVILAIALLATSYRALSPGIRIATILIGAAGIAFHASHLPIGLGVTGLAALLLLIATWRRNSVPTGQWAAILAPFVIGAALTVALNSVAFGGASLTGKRFPLTLARSIAEGPGKWYLDRNCSHLKYAVCEVYPNGVPDSIETFLWGKTGIKERATPEQLERIRAEESEVVLAATRAYPFEEFRRLAFNFGRQLVHFEPGVGLGARIVVGPDGNPVSEYNVPYNSIWVGITGTLSIVAVLASLVLLAFRWRSAPQLRALTVLLLLGILLNVAVCVYFSGVTARYQARVIWLIPLLALMALAPAGRRAVEDRGELQG
jgi:hypothetical protein